MNLLTNLTPALPLATFTGMVLGCLMGFLSLFLILLILVQRGRGGGLSGALGGPGGQSAFGSKAGDTFTAITVGLAGVWILVCAFAMWSLGMHTPAVAEFNDSTLSAGPNDDVEDIASGLVVPTLDDDKADDSDVDLEPSDEDTDAAQGEVDASDFEEPADETKE